MAKLITFRILGATVTLFAIATLIFWAFEALPGDVAARVLGRYSTAEARTAFRNELGLNRPAVVRYGEWLSAAVRGDFGKSYASRRDVREIVAPRLQNTLILAAFAFLIYVPVTILIATLAALFHERALDRSFSVLVLLGISMPEYVLGSILIIVFAVYLPLFPAISVVQRAKSPAELIYILVLPAITLCVLMSAYAIRMLRDNLIEVLDSEYVRMATLKGVPRVRVVLRHALPNALLPALNITALNLAYLIGGVVIVERVFAYDGLGTLLVDAIFTHDVPIIQAVTLIVSAVYILANLGADIAGILLNPKQRTAR